MAGGPLIPTLPKPRIFREAEPRVRQIIHETGEGRQPSEPQGWLGRSQNEIQPGIIQSECPACAELIPVVPKPRASSHSGSLTWLGWGDLAPAPARSPGLVSACASVGTTFSNKRGELASVATVRNRPHVGIFPGAFPPPFKYPPPPRII
jgi:hypothetical protein